MNFYYFKISFTILIFLNVSNFFLICRGWTWPVTGINMCGNILLFFDGFNHILHDKIVYTWSALGGLRPWMGNWKQFKKYILYSFQGKKKYFRSGRNHEFVRIIFCVSKNNLISYQNIEIRNKYIYLFIFMKFLQIMISIFQERSFKREVEYRWWYWVTWMEALLELVSIVDCYFCNFKARSQKLRKSFIFPSIVSLCDNDSFIDSSVYTTRFQWRHPIFY